MSMDWDENITLREMQKQKAVASMSRKLEKEGSGRGRQTKEKLTVERLLKYPYHLICRFKIEHPDIYSRLFDGESFEIREDWFPPETESQARAAFEAGKITAKAAHDERIPPKKSFKSLDYEEARNLPREFWEESARLHFGQGLSSDESLEVAYQKMRKGEKGEKNA